jgi:hypothetical protein
MPEFHQGSCVPNTVLSASLRLMAIACQQFGTARSLSFCASLLFLPPTHHQTLSAAPCQADISLKNQRELVLHRRKILECPAFFVPVVMIETGTRGAEDGTREEAHT